MCFRRGLKVVLKHGFGHRRPIMCFRRGLKVVLKHGFGHRRQIVCFNQCRAWRRQWGENGNLQKSEEKANFEHAIRLHMGSAEEEECEEYAGGGGEAVVHIGGAA